MTLSDIPARITGNKDRRFFLFLYLGVFLGIFFVNVFHLSALYIFGLFWIIVVQIGIFYRKAMQGLGIFLLSLCIGGTVAYLNTLQIQKNTHLFQEITSFFTQDVRIEWILTEKNNEWPNRSSYILRDLRIGEKSFEENIGILTSFSNTYRLSIWDRVSFTGRLSLPSSHLADFDYRKYLLLKDVYATTMVSFSEKIGTDNPNGIIRIIRSVREKILSIIGSIYPGETAVLLEGILIGERTSLSNDTKTDFNRSGLTHIIAVSGSNITILLIFLSFFLKPFARPIQVVLIISVISVFTLLVWFQIPVLRASIFGLIAYIFLLADRRVRVFPLLIGIALLFCVYEPLILNYDTSFHLSFLAVFGLIFLLDFFEKMVSFLPRTFAIRESLAMTLAVTVFTIPIMVVNFGQVSIIAPIANMAVVPVLPLVMFFGTLSLAISIFSAPFGVMVGFIGWCLLQYILIAVHFFWGLSFATLPIDLWMFKYLFEIVYFGVLVGFLLLKNSEKRKRI